MKSLILVTIFIVFILLLNVAAQESDSVLLKYDDGDPNLQLTFGGNYGTYFVTRFTPPSFPATLTKAQFYIPDTSKGASFNFSVRPDAFNEPGDPLFGPVPMRAKKIGWNEIDLSTYNLRVKGDFYLELAYDLVSKLTLGAENREPLSGRTYDTDC